MVKQNRHCPLGTCERPERPGNDSLAGGFTHKVFRGERLPVTADFGSDSRFVSSLKIQSCVKCRCRARACGSASGQLCLTCGVVRLQSI